jgi:Cu(I)/Ag(I) efflux system protein CusF
MNTRIIFTAVLAFATVAPAVAQSMASMPGMAANSPSKTGKSTGVITVLDPAAAKVTLSHGPIAALGWPAMTMTFVATPPALLKGLKIGEKVDFAMRMNGNRAEVTAVHPR